MVSAHVLDEDCPRQERLKIDLKGANPGGWHGVPRLSWGLRNFTIYRPRRPEEKSGEEKTLTCLPPTATHRDV